VEKALTKRAAPVGIAPLLSTEDLTNSKDFEIEELGK